MAKDYYATLGIDKNASQDDIKKAYKKLAKKYHPDINKEENSAEKFKEINEAFATLGDENKRSNYDRFGTTEDFQGFQGGGFGGFEDIFESFFGGGFGGRQRQSRGANLKTEIELDFEDAAFGTKKDITLNKLVNCQKCDATGAENKELETCSDCQGRGRKQNRIRTPFGIMSQTITCNTCQGKGQSPKENCSTCKGQGRIKQKKTVTVTIPAGVDNGSTLRVSGEGEAGQAGYGDLYVELYVKPHKIFEREGNHILLTQPINFTQAALGTKLEIPTLEGTAELKIPAGTQSHTIFRMRGKGIEDVNYRGKGDQLVKILVKTPTTLNKQEKELLERLGGKEHTPEKGFFEKFKEKFI